MHNLSGLGLSPIALSHSMPLMALSEMEGFVGWATTGGLCG